MLTAPRASCRPRLDSLLVLFAFSVLPTLHAQGISFLGNQLTFTDSLSAPQSTAVDSGGNVFVADTGNGRIVKITPGASADCNTGCTVIASGFNSPAGIALDKSGNLYVTDTSAGTVVRVSSAGTKTTLASLTAPGPIAVDGSGNSFVALAAGVVAQVTPGGVVTTVASGLNQPAGIAVDAGGDLYIADSGSGQVIEVVSGVQSVLVTGLNSPLGVAIDSAGTLYVADSGNNRVLSVPPGTPSTNCSSGCVTLGSGLSSPVGLSVDASGNVYLASGNQAVEISGDVSFSSTAIASATSKTLTWQMAGADCSAVHAVNVLTRGAPSKDFTSSASTNTCTPGSPATFAITVNFAPLYAGQRTGSVQLTDANGDVRAVTYLHGTGTGPQVTWTPGVLSQATP